MSAISIICPIYNVENFIERNATSLLKQTFADIEYIFVNDATPDKSITILNSIIEKYPARNVRIINHPVNKGLPAARNTGLSHATGKYIFHCDSDDFLETNAMEALYSAAIEKNADIVWSDYFLSFKNSEKYMKQPDHFSAIDAIADMTAGKMKYNVWNKLIKRELYNDNNISFPEGYSMGEDMTIMMLFLHAKNIAYVNQALYHYIQWNTSALTFGGDCVRHLDVLEYNTKRVSKYLKEHSPINMDLNIAALQLNTKWPFLLDGKKESFNRWRNWFEEANNYIWDIPNTSKRMKIIQWCAKNNLFCIIKLHYWIVCRLYYGIVYK